MAIRRISIDTCILVCCIVSSTIASPIASERDHSELGTFETKLISTLDALSQKDSIKLIGDYVSIEKVNIDSEQMDQDSDETDPLLKKIDSFLRNRRLRIKLINENSTAGDLGRASQEGNVDFEMRGLIHGASEARTKLKRIILPLLLALKLKAIVVLPIILTVIGLIGIKGLGAGVLALLLSGAVALKALLTPSNPLYPARLGFAKPYEWHRSQEELIGSQPYRAWAPEIGVEPQYIPYPDIP
ncbi:hypothetical protein QAD02_020152 [Eretmocerus hayati]|uniref:Uncharacterized protein n=1 Tax=Eretmocerus hayati TaxID=131215 RepID=A0ACC2PRE6_9HYME|nr:hypothetical protein QAD02_020152 [Eretmocerus hayati]